MKFLVDQQLPKKLAGWIRERGCEAHHLKEIGMLHAEDADIWREADARGAVIVSKAARAEMAKMAASTNFSSLSRCEIGKR